MPSSWGMFVYQTNVHSDEERVTFDGLAVFHYLFQKMCCVLYIRGDHSYNGL